MELNTDVTDHVFEQKVEGQRAQLAYEKALRDGSVNVYRGRILLIGQERAGKTSLMKSLLGLPFDPNEQSTEGIEVQASTCEIENGEVKNWHSTFENKPGLQEYSRDISRIVEEKLSEMREDHFQEEGGGLSDRNDLNKHQVESDITKKEPVTSLDVWDFSGQHLYYASHPFFFSSRALYILVHNLSKPLHAPAKHCVRQGSFNIPLENPNNETNLENLLSWLTTIHSITQMKEEPDIGAESRLPYLRPPVLIVGTHADKPFEGITVIKSQIQKILSGRELGKHVVPPLFSIDNTNSLPQNLRKRFFRRLQGPMERKYQTEQRKNTNDIQDLRDKIMEVLNQEPYMGEKIPVRWFLFERVIEALIAQQIYHSQIEQLQNYAEKHCFIEDADEFASMISFYHDLGMIIKHRSTVVLKAQWLIDLLQQLINIPRFDKMDPVYTKYWVELKKNGILCMEHIDHVFSKFIQQGVIKDDILDMMEQFGLIAKFSPSPSDIKYFVPAQLESSPEDFCQIEPSHTDPCPLYLHFVHGFIPCGLFSQLVSQTIRWCLKKTWPMEHPKLYQNGACFFIGKQVHNFILICKKSFIKIILRQRLQSQQVSADKSEELPSLVREFVERTLQTLSKELPYLSGLQYELCVACPYCHQGRGWVGQECSNHGRVSCEDEECFHLLEVKQDQLLICMRTFWDELCTVHGLEKWFLKRTSQDLSPSFRAPTTQDATAKENQGKPGTALSVTLVANHVFEQNAEGQRAQLAYEKALRDGFVDVSRGRILLIGQDRAGKTSLKKSLLGLPFDPEEQSTEGIEVQASTCEIEVEQVKNWHSTGGNKPGLQEYSRDISIIVKEKLSDGTTDLDREHSAAATEATAVREEEHVEDEVVQLELSAHYKCGESNKHQVKATVGHLCKSDMSVPSRKTKRTSKQDSANGEHLPDCRSENEPDEPDVIINATSPPDDITKHVLDYIRGKGDIPKGESVVTMDVWDFAGQHLYYASVPLFLSSRAIYVLVHNLSKPLYAPAEPGVRQGTLEEKLENPNNETNLENLLSWLATIHSVTQEKEETDYGAQRPPVLIVGTHADKPAQDIAVMKSVIEERITSKEYGKHVVQPLFSIDNTSSLIGPERGTLQTELKRNTDDIQELRNKIMEVLGREPYMGQKIPVRWFLFEKVIEALTAQNIYHRHIKQLQNYAKKHCFIEDAVDFDGMISFYHGLGMIIMHGSTVVLKAQWLIGLLKQLITIPHFNEMYAVHRKYWQELTKSGILCMELVDHAFSKFIQEGVIKDDILNMMEQFGLIAKFSPAASDEKYFVPAQLKTPPKGLCQVTPSDADPCPLYIHFVHDFVPHGLFSQLVSRFVCWCCNTWPFQHPKLYQNGAWFVIGKQIHDLIVICKKSFIKIVLRQKLQSCQVSAEKSEELATQVRVFVEETLQTLSQELPYLSGLQYKLYVACPYCHRQGKDGVGQKCSNHGRVSCDDEECFHLLEMKEDQPLICMETFCDDLRTVRGLEKWFLKRTSQDLSPSTRVPITQDAPAKENQVKSGTALSVTLLASELDSSKGGLSTVNIELAIELAQHEQVKVTILVPKSSCSEEGKIFAESHNVSIREAERLPGYDDSLVWLSFPPRDLVIDIIVGHGGKLGKQAQVIRKSHKCKWVQVLHTAPEELGMYKNYPKAISKGEEKNRIEIELCELADAVAAVGPKLTEAYSSYLRFCKKHQDIIELTPGIFSEFSDITQATNERDKFKVLTFGRGDPEDFSLKGYDIAAKAIVELKDSSYHLVFVGAPDGKQEEVAENLLQSGISRNQLFVRRFIQRKERLKELFCEVDLVIMPSRTEGFGLTALEALSAGLPILVSGNSGFGNTLCTLPLGKPFVVNSANPEDWAKAIRAVRLKDRTERLQEIQRLRTSYEEKFSWKKQCGALVEKMWSLVHASEKPATHEAYSTSQSSAALRQITSESPLHPDLPGQMFVNLQQMQCDVSKVSSNTDLLAELEKIASDKGFVISNNEGSGNCMFHALSEQLNFVKGIKISHGELRQSIMQYLRENPKLPDGTDLFNFVDGYQSWADYLSNMEKDGTWGDHVILYGTANCYKMYIDVISSQSNHSDLTISPDGHVMNTNPLVLGHVHEVHYVSLLPKRGLQSKSR